MNRPTDSLAYLFIFLKNTNDAFAFLFLRPSRIWLTSIKHRNELTPPLHYIIYRNNHKMKNSPENREITSISPERWFSSSLPLVIDLNNPPPMSRVSQTIDIKPFLINEEAPRGTLPAKAKVRHRNELIE